MPNDYKSVNGVRVQLTDAEQAVRNAEIAESNNSAFDFALKNLSIRIILFSFSFNLIMRLTFCVFEIIETISATFFGIDSKRSGQSFLL